MGSHKQFRHADGRATPVQMTLDIQLEQEGDGRWIGEVASLPGVLAYGTTRTDALAKGQALALRVLADRLAHGEAASILA